eukprot:s175_g15.t1
MISLFCALRRVKGPGARINAAMLQQWKSKFEQSTKEKTCFWAVPAESPALALPEVKQFIVPAEELAEVPRGLLEQKVESGSAAAAPATALSASGKEERILRRASSEPETEESTAEYIAQEIQKAFSAKRVSSLDLLDSKCATFWFNAYTKDILKKFEESGQGADEFTQALDPCSQAIVKNTVKALLETSALPQLSFSL